MANRYANLVGSRKISEDWSNINVGFDRVQADMDSKETPEAAQVKIDAAKKEAIDKAAAALTAHKQRGADEHPTAKGNAAGFMSAADKLKSDASTNTATPDTLMQRDAAGRAKVAAPAAADDIARKAEVDAVQANLDSHAADIDIHVTAEDHAKLNNIQEGAEVNQNAFAQVNNVLASDPSDTVTFVGGTGITVSTNPATKQVTVTATGEATPGPHASSHITGGSDVIPDAVTNGSSGLMSGDDAKFVREDGETKEGAQEKADAVKEYVDGRLNTPERAAITLQPGVQAVNADQDAAFRLAGLQGRTALNYQSQIGIFGVLNPYVIRYGLNLLPPFYEAGLAGSGQWIINSYSATLNASGTNMGWTYRIPCAANTDYTLAVNHNGMIALQDLDSAGTIIQNSGYQDASELHIKTAANAAYLSVVIGNGSKGAGSYSFSNPMLTLGSAAKSFKPREDVMLALQTELHANPDTGANPDMVFERDGQYFKLAKWNRLVLDGSYAYSILNNYTGYKRVLVTASFPTATAVSYATKYNGTMLQDEDTALAADRYNINSNAVLISIANTDSGWGDAYTPTADEIKAYFLGWIMCDANTAQFFTGAAGQTKCWAPIANPRNRIGSLGWANYVLALPTTKAPVSGGYEYHPYQLLYQLATPVVEPISSEGQLTFFEGNNQVEIGTGIVLREKANPKYYGVESNINDSQTKLSKATNRILRVYKDSLPDVSWKLLTNNDYGYGGAVAQKVGQFDTSAAYSLTYLMLDKYPAVDFSGTYAENEKALLLDAVKSIQENTTRISVLESKKAEKDATSWITPTLLNGAVHGTMPVKFTKLSDSVVLVTGLTVPAANGTSIFKLPVGYRPKSDLTFSVMSLNTSGNLVASNVGVSPTGDVWVGYFGNSYVSLSGIVFLAEQ